RPTATTQQSPLSLHDALPISAAGPAWVNTSYCSILTFLHSYSRSATRPTPAPVAMPAVPQLLSVIAVSVPSRLAPMRSFCSDDRSEEHTSELQSRVDLVCRLL